MYLIVVLTDVRIYTVYTFYLLFYCCYFYVVVVIFEQPLAQEFPSGLKKSFISSYVMIHMICVKIKHVDIALYCSPPTQQIGPAVT